MSTTRPAPLRNVLHREIDRDDRSAAHGSRRFPGHEARLASHTHHIRTRPCDCGSGMPYGECCIAGDRQKSEPGIHYALPPELIEDLSQRRAIEDGFRISAFRAFYRAFRQEHDPALRFIKALLASAKPIDDRQQILEWHQKFRRRKQAQEALP